MGYTWEILRTEDALAQFAGAWGHLWQEAAWVQPFFHPEWVGAWQQTMDVGRTPVVIVVHDEAGQLAGLWPFVEVLSVGVSGLWPMSFHIGDFFEPLVRTGGDAELWAALAQGLEACLAEHAFVWLPLLPKAVWAALSDSAQSAYFKKARVREVDVRLRCELAIADLEPTGKHAKTRRYEMDKLEAFGAVRFECLSEADAVRAFIPRLRWLERQSWKTSAGMGLFRLPGAREFYTEALPALAEQGVACVEVLYAGQEVVACQIGLLGEGYYGLHNTAYHPAFAESSPGAHLLRYSMQQAKERGVRVYDFMQGAQDYKKRHATEQDALLEVTLFARGFAGLACRALTKLRGKA